MRNKVLQIISRADGWTGHDDKYVARYDPTVHKPDGGYDGGILELTDDPRKALKFSDAGEALEKWRQPAGCQCHGIRPWDGKPNRPLTAYTVTVIDAPGGE
jgi:hypothetical protein